MDRESKIQNLVNSYNLWLVCGVNHHSPWPQNHEFITYSGLEFVLLGLYRNSRPAGASIIMPLTNQEETDKKLKILNDFCAELSWLEGRYVKIVRRVVTSSLGVGCEGDTNTSYGTHVGISRYNLLRGDLEKCESLTLAFWNDALQLEDSNILCAFLLFYKIIEAQFEEKDSKNKVINWINLAIEEIKSESANYSILQDSRIVIVIEFLKDKTDDIGKYLYINGRCSIAHATLDKFVANPNDPEDIKTISMATILMKSLAKKCIKEKLKLH